MTLDVAESIWPITFMKETYLGSVYLPCCIPPSAANKYRQKISGQSNDSAFLSVAGIHTDIGYISKKTPV